MEELTKEKQIEMLDNFRKDIIKLMAKYPHLHILGMAKVDGTRHIECGGNYCRLCAIGTLLEMSIVMKWEHNGEEKKH